MNFDKKTQDRKTEVLECLIADCNNDALENSNYCELHVKDYKKAKFIVDNDDKYQNDVHEQFIDNDNTDTRNIC